MDEVASIYDNRKVTLPQVKVADYDKERLYSFLAIFNRSYATFIRDVCDSITKYRIDTGRVTFTGFMERGVREVVKDYIKSDSIMFRATKGEPRKNLIDEIGLHRYPYPRKIVRLPTVKVSAWQADNLHGFLRMFHRSYAEFVRMLCQNVIIDVLDAQASMPHFVERTETVFAEILDQIIEKNKLMGKEPVKSYYRPSSVVRDSHKYSQ